MKKRTVEDALTLDVQLFIHSVVGADDFTSRDTIASTIIWQNQHTGKQVADVAYLLVWRGELPTVVLKYRTRGRWYQDAIRFTSITPSGGGVRYYFRCPGCDRRVGKLHTFTGARFRCRDCHDLTYAGTQGQRRLSADVREALAALGW